MPSSIELKSFCYVKRRSLCLSLALASALVACGLTAREQPVAPTPTVVPATVQLPTPTPSVVPDTGWQLLRQGLERRVLNYLSPQRELEESLYLLRISPDHFRFDVAYQPGEPISIHQWQIETGALIVLNGGFFTDSFEATGLIIENGVASGTSYSGFGGMFVVTAAGPEIRSLAERPYSPDEGITAALQSFPMIIEPGGRIGPLGEYDQQARRTVIGQDRHGRILFIVAGAGASTLPVIGERLLESDLELSIALNLDGGASTGLILAEPSEGIVAYSLLPSVITVHPK